MAIAVVAFQRNEEIAGLKRARVDGKRAHAKRRACLAQVWRASASADVHNALSAPSAMRPPAAMMASSRSENGWVSRPMVWPLSWPLPAIIRVSPSPKRRDCRADRQRAVADIPRGGTTGERFLADGRGVFAAGIVVGDDYLVRKLAGGFAHQRALALVAVAAAAEHDMQIVLHMRADGGEHGLQRIRRVRVIDIDRRARFGIGDFFETTRRALQLRQRDGENIARAFAQADGKGCSDQRIRRLKTSGERQFETVALALIRHAQRLATFMRHAGHELQRGVFFADGDQAHAAAAGGFDKRFGVVGIRVHHRHAIGAGDFGEKAQLGRRDTTQNRRGNPDDRA